MFNQILLNGIISGSIYALIALGFAIIYKTVRFFHFAHGIVYTAGAYCVYSLSISLGINVILSFFLASSFSAILGIAIDRCIYLPLRKNNAPPLVFLIASFGVFILIQNLLQLIYGAQILTLRTGVIKEGHQFLGAVITDIQILILVVSCWLLVMLWFVVERTKMGKAIRAVADDPVGASVAGIILKGSFSMPLVLGLRLRAQRVF